MASKVMEAEIARKNAEMEKNPSPGNQHALSLLEARVGGLLVHVNTPQRGTPFLLDQVGTDAGKEVQEKVGLGYVTASKVVLPAHDGSLCILQGHAPMVGLLGSGEVRVTTRAARIPSARFMDRTLEIQDSVVYRLFVTGGTFQVMENEVLILPERGFLPHALVVEDLDEEESRRAVKGRISEEDLEGEALNQVLLEAKKEEVARHRTAVEARDPSIEKEDEMTRIRAMEKVLG